MIEYDEDDHSTGLLRAQHELKRVDHLIYVSLKYTRTVDVIKNIIHRLINTYDFVFSELLERLEDEGKIYQLPSAPGLRTKLIRQHFADDDVLIEFLSFYVLLRQLYKSEYKALREFRRHVTMEAYLPNGDVQEVNIDIISDYFRRTKEFVNHAKAKYELNTQVA